MSGKLLSVLALTCWSLVLAIGAEVNHNCPWGGTWRGNYTYFTEECGWCLREGVSLDFTKIDVIDFHDHFYDIVESTTGSVCACEKPCECSTNGQGRYFADCFETFNKAPVFSMSSFRGIVVNDETFYSLFLQGESKDLYVLSWISG